MRTKIYKLSIAFLGLILFIIFTFTEKASAQEYISLKLDNLAKFKGYILESFDSSGINLIVKDVPIFIKYDHIRSIRLRSGSAKNKEMMNENFEFRQFKKGFYHSAGLGLISGNGYSDISASIVNGYKFNKYLNAGLGLNYDRYENMSAIPIYAEGKGYMMTGKFVPYYFAQLGYGFTVEDNHGNYYSEYDSQGGIYWKVGVGYQINFYKTALAFGIGYMNQNSKAEYFGNYYYAQPWSSYYAPPEEITEKRSLRRVDVKINLVF